MIVTCIYFLNLLYTFFSQSEIIWIISLSAALKMYKNCSNLDNFLNWLDIALIFLMATSCNCLKMGCSHTNKIWNSSPITFSQYGQILKFLGVFGLEYLPLSIGRLWSDNLNLAMYLLSEVKFKYVSNFRLLFTLAKNYNICKGKFVLDPYTVGQKFFMKIVRNVHSASSQIPWRHLWIISTCNYLFLSSGCLIFTVILITCYAHYFINVSNLRGCL